MREVLKFQRPLNPPDGPMLIYNQDRSIMQTLPMTDELRALFGDAPKFYALCSIDDKGEVELIRLVTSRGW